MKKKENLMKKKKKTLQNKTKGKKGDKHFISIHCTLQNYCERLFSVQKYCSLKDVSKKTKRAKEVFLTSNNEHVLLFFFKKKKQQSYSLCMFSEIFSRINCLKAQIQKLNNELSDAQEEDDIYQISEEISQKRQEQTEIQEVIKRLKADIASTKRSTTTSIRNTVFSGKDEFADHPIIQQQRQEEKQRKNRLQERLREIRLSEEIQEYYQKTGKKCGKKSTTKEIEYSANKSGVDRTDTKVYHVPTTSCASSSTVEFVPKKSSFVEETLLKKKIANEIAQT